MRFQSDEPAEIRTDGTTDIHYAATYSPGVLSKKQAGYVTVHAGVEASGADIPLVSVPFVRVSGKVIGMPADMEYRSIRVTPIDAGRSVGRRSYPFRRDGSFELWRLDPGKYSLEAECSSTDGSQARTGTVEIEVAGSNVDDIALRVVPDSDIPGRIEFENDAGRQALTSEKSPVTIHLRRPGEPDIDSSPLDKDGAFQFRKVPAARYKSAISSEAVYVKSVRFGSTQIDGPYLDLSNGSSGSDLEIVLIAAAGSISGIVHDEQGFPTEAQVVVEGNETVDGVYSMLVSSKADGTYSMNHLPPGGYTVIAIPRADFSFDAITDYDDQMEEFSIHGDEKVRKI